MVFWKIDRARDSNRTRAISPQIYGIVSVFDTAELSTTPFKRFRLVEPLSYRYPSSNDSSNRTARDQHVSHRAPSVASNLKATPLVYESIINNAPCSSFARSFGVRLHHEHLSWNSNLLPGLYGLSIDASRVFGALRIPAPGVRPRWSD